MVTRTQALADVEARREALLKTCGEFQLRVSPSQLAEDALGLIDPQLTILGRLRAGVEQNKLLSLAVLAGIGWLVGAPRRHNGGPRSAREAGSATRKTMKETINDSGEEPGHQRRTHRRRDQVNDVLAGSEATLHSQADEDRGGPPFAGGAKVGRGEQDDTQAERIPEAERR